MSISNSPASRRSLTVIKAGMRRAVARPQAGFHSLAPTTPRAFELFDRVPDGCKLFRLDGNEHSPHLREGELAVIDLADCEYRFGELYLIQWSGEKRSRSIRQVKKRLYYSDHAKKIEAEGVWFLPLCQPRFLADGKIDWRYPVYCADGPLNPIYLPEYLLGRVIGIFAAIKGSGTPTPIIPSEGAL
jgi:hypothetical protein